MGCSPASGAEKVNAAAVAKATTITTVKANAAAATVTATATARRKAAAVAAAAVTETDFAGGPARPALPGESPTSKIPERRACPSGIFCVLVRKAGLEPARHRRQDLNLVRLPISPLPQVSGQGGPVSESGYSSGFRARFERRRPHRLRPRDGRPTRRAHGCTRPR